MFLSLLVEVEEVQMLAVAAVEVVLPTITE